MIYFAQADGTDLVKIGFTGGDPAKRVSDLQTASPHKLTLLASVEGSEQDEGKWHQEFASDRVKGEWFRMSWRLCLAIARAEAAAAALSPIAPFAGVEVLLKAQERDLIVPQFACRTCQGRRLFHPDPESDATSPCDDCHGTGFMCRNQGLYAANDAPIAMICEKRHDKGEPDITYPAVFCMVCGGRISQAKHGNAFWMPTFEEGEQVFYASRWHVVFAHKKCNPAVARMSSWMPLEDFVAYLGRNLGIKDKDLAGV